jgi:ATP-dependent RNA helicase DDX46/PRP5
VSTPSLRTSPNTCANLALPQRRHRDRDREGYRRRDRSVDRRYDDRRGDETYTPSRRDRSRDRRRSKDRDERRRSRDRDHRTRREDSRDRTRRRRDGSADSKQKSRRDDSKDRSSRKDSGHPSREVSCLASTSINLRENNAQRVLQNSKPSTPTTQSGDDEMAARRAKIEAWKQKQAAEYAKKQKDLEAAGGARSILHEIDKKAGLSSATASPAAASPRSPDTPVAASPVPYAGKFDPKAIVKKAHSSVASSVPLGSDIAHPEAMKASGSLTSADNEQASSGALKPRGNLSGFGISTKAAADADKSKTALDFDDEDSSRKKLAKLPTLPSNDENGMNGEVANANGEPDEGGDDDDVDMQDAGTEEENLAAVRAAAERREELLQLRSQAEIVDDNDRASANVDGDTSMAEASDLIEQATPMKEEEEADPLDAFMSDLSTAPTRPSTLNGIRSTKVRQQEPEAMFGDEGDDLTAIGADPNDILAIASKKKKKDIPTVNHAKINYEPFRRNFYSEPVDMADYTEEDVANLRLELDGIKVRGVDVPKPVTKWAQCGLGVQSLDVVQKLGYEAPTSIQSQAIPAIMSGRDVIGVAKTGSGKTIAFLLPMFRHIKDQRPLDSLEGPVGLVMTPTRELATQIHKECKPFLKALNLRAVCAYGGAPIKDQIADLKRGAEIIVCTPGRMIDLLAANSGRVTNLRRVTYVVLDEADRMFDMGFEPQVMKILANIRPNRQTVLFSATFPRQMEALARKTLSKPVEIVVGGRSVVAPEITQIVEVRNDDKKFVRLLELLGNMYADEKNEDDRTLIFVDRQESADSLLRDLMKKGYPCMSIHGGKDQIDRDSTIEDFKAGIVPILIATSVAARGLDVKQLKLVVNFDAPNHLEDYVHRTGRTGRAGNTGTAVTFLTDEQDRYAMDIAKALRQSGQPVPEPVQKLVDAFMEKVKAGKEKASNSGFGGKGLEKLDQERDAAKARERKTYKTGEEGDEEEKEEKDTTGDDLVAKAASGVKAFDATPVQIPGVPKGIDLDGKITVHKTEREPAGTGPKNQEDRVRAAVQGINERLSKAGVMRQGVPIDNKGPDAGAFHATLEINDFPRKCSSYSTELPNLQMLTVL